MDLVQLAAFAFLAGLTACGIAASLCELLGRQQVRFGEPFVSSEHLQRSVAVMIAAGPFMLVNDAEAAWRNGGISASTFALCGVAAVAWLTAAGLVLLALASAVLGPIG